MKRGRCAALPLSTLALLAGCDRGAVYWLDTERKGQEYGAIAHVVARRIDGADPASYRLIAHGHAHDAQRVYHEGVPFAVRDAARCACPGRATPSMATGSGTSGARWPLPTRQRSK